MAYFSLPLDLVATVYIQAASLTEAKTKFDRIASKGIDARDKRWFSNAPFGSFFLPELSFATSMTLLKPTGRGCGEIEESDLRQQLTSREQNLKASVLPHSADWFGEGTLPVYTVDLHVRTTGFVRAASLGEAEAFVAKLDDNGVHWETAAQWFEFDGMNDKEYPLILSPSITVVGISRGCEVSLRWPLSKDEPDYAAELNAAIRKLSEGFSILEIGGLAKRLKHYFATTDMSFTLLGDDEIMQLAGQLIGYRIEKQSYNAPPQFT
ncbi:hypothetical protein ELH93_34350 [Rhizobium leguminosarum]|uniref:hypothetical protein n=1 Tax=Rhizobium leguminosarum TaxID=384 RepID=UPI001031B021|nr:hypothetical protein [Rhizobium leguminosarum]TAY25179.1 hypothetical protein ELH93_34350 [Rhizobium leguminosarum]